MLRENAYYRKKKLPLNLETFWLKGLGFIIFITLFMTGVVYSLENGAGSQFVSALSKWDFPMEMFLMEGSPGLSAPKRGYLEELRKQGMATGMFLMTGVNISDARTFFLGYYSSPPEGPQWLAWAYNPRDPEFEGTILEPIEKEDTSGESGTAASPDPGTEPSGQNAQETETAAPDVGDKQVTVGIYHTHNSESYSGDGGSDRVSGKNGDVVTVGDTLAQVLNKDGIKVFHSKVIHDGTDFMKAYSSSINTATKMLKDYPGIKVLIDIHRDGFPSGADKVTTTINGKAACQIRFVIGQKNSHWKENEALAEELVAIGEKKFPGLFAKDFTYASDARYNQHLSNGALLLEFGSQLNTLEESNRAAEAVAEVLNEWLKTH